MANVKHVVVNCRVSFAPASLFRSGGTHALHFFPTVDGIWEYAEHLNIILSVQSTLIWKWKYATELRLSPFITLRLGDMNESAIYKVNPRLEMLR